MTTRVLFFLLDGDSNASSWHRVLQYVPILRQYDIAPQIARPVPERVYQRLVERGGGRGQAKLGFYGLFLVQRLVDVLRASRADVVVVQRDLFPFGPPLLERLLFRRARRLVYDTDDATYLRPAFTPDTPFQRWRRFDKVAEMVRHARWVSVATEPLAAWARQLNGQVSVVPMAVDLAAYDAVPRVVERGPDAPIVLGWAGTAGGRRYLEALAPVLRDLAQRLPIVVRVISGDGQGICLPGVPLDARPWRAASGLTEMAGFDVGLVPLDDSPFEQAKFPFKLLQYLALGVPAVSARVGLAPTVLRDGEPGLLASGAEQWLSQLERVVRDPDLRARLGAAGRETVAARYTLERVGPLLAAGLRQAAS